MKNRSYKPKQIEIGGLIYTIKYVEPRRIGKDKSISVRGEIDFHTREIFIEKGLSRSEEIVTLIHEILHAVLDTFIPATILDAMDHEEELIINPTARILAGALRSAGLLKE